MSFTTAPPKRPPGTRTVPPAAVPPAGPPPDPPRTGSVKRLLAGCAIVLALSAAISALFISGEISVLTKALSANPSLNLAPGSLANSGFGGPQTLLLVGDDQRALTKYYHRAVLPHSNEMLLVRLDPNKPWISMLSIPRDLQVTIYPRHSARVTTRFNYAYTAGGIPLLLSTIKRVLGLSVNHVVVITFARFKRAVDQMGCVYSTIDRRYFHSNVGSAEQYQEINLQPGYQKLCGTEALQFVSYRHGDTALVRDARNQSFLLDVKKQYGPTLTGNVHKFEHVFGQAVQTDQSLHTSTGVLDLLATLVSSAGRRVRQVQFQANLLPNSVTATPKQISASVDSFLNGGSALPKRSTAATARSVHGHGPVASLPLVATGSADLAQARTNAGDAPFALEYPHVRDRAGAADPVQLRTYQIHATDGTAFPAYVAAFSAGALGQFYDVQGTTWTSAPQFDSPDQSVNVGRRTYSLYYEAQRLKMVAWHEHGAVYWVRNTLADSVDNGELLAIAEQTTPFQVGAPGKRRVLLGAAGVPNRQSRPANTGTAQTLGGIAGLLTLVAIPFLAFRILKRRRELAALKTQLRATLALEARLTNAAHAMRGPRPPRPAVAHPPAAPPARK